MCPREPSFARVASSSLEGGQSAPALRFGDPRVMALAGALVAHAVRRRRLHQRSLRAQVAGLLGAPYSRGQMTYDLRRLRLKGLIARLPHSNTYRLTPDGLRVAVFYVKVHDRLLTPLIAADAPPGPPELRHALTTIDRHINDFTAKARIGT